MKYNAADTSTGAVSVLMSEDTSTVDASGMGYTFAQPKRGYEAEREEAEEKRGTVLHRH